MRILTLNLNGIRAAAKKGFFDWVHTQHIDILCLQEVRAQSAQLAPFQQLTGYQVYFSEAEKKGYSGVAIYSRYTPERIVNRLDWAVADQEGRYIQLDFPNWSVVSLYLPSGTSGHARQQCKFQFLEYYGNILKAQRQQAREFILCGDWNIAHRPIDLKNWRANQKHSGFLPEERAWLDYVFDELGYVDAFRQVNSAPDQYTWWSNRGRAWANNVGWRIDYQIVTPGLASKIKEVSIYKAQRFSDHAPLLIDYALQPPSLNHNNQ